MHMDATIVAPLVAAAMCAKGGFPALASTWHSMHGGRPDECAPCSVGVFWGHVAYLRQPVCELTSL